MGPQERERGLGVPAGLGPARVGSVLGKKRANGEPHAAEGLEGGHNSWEWCWLNRWQEGGMGNSSVKRSSPSSCTGPLCVYLTPATGGGGMGVGGESLCPVIETAWNGHLGPVPSSATDLLHDLGQVPFPRAVPPFPLLPLVHFR